MTQTESLSLLALSMIFVISGILISIGIEKGKVTLRAGILSVFLIVTFSVAGWLLVRQQGLFAATCGSLIAGVGSILGFAAIPVVRSKLRKTRTDQAETR